MIPNTQLGILYPIGYFLLLVLYCVHFLQRASDLAVSSGFKEAEKPSGIKVYSTKHLYVGAYLDDLIHFIMIVGIT